jgi:hypothetical protein
MSNLLGMHYHHLGSEDGVQPGPLPVLQQFIYKFSEVFETGYLNNLLVICVAPSQSSVLSCVLYGYIFRFTLTKSS